MRNNVLKEKSVVFALDIISLYKKLASDKEYVLSKQLLRSGTAIGALITEAEFAHSKKDFINKLHIALKEANETAYWLELLNYSHYISKEECTHLLNKNNEILKILISSINTSKNNLKNENK